MATCRKTTLKEQISAAEKTAGRKLTKVEQRGLALLPQQYVCSGAGVGGSKSKP